MSSSATSEYTIRRKVFTLVGAKFHVYNGSGDLIGFSKQKAFKLKEDIRFFSDESMSREVMSINARSVLDFSAAYDVTDSSTGQKIGALRRKGVSSLVRDEWMVMDANDNLMSQIREDSTAMGLIRRFIPMGNLVPQTFHLGDDQQTFAEFNTHFNPFVHRMTVQVYPNCPIHAGLVLAGGILLVALEGRQSN